MACPVLASGRRLGAPELLTCGSDSYAHRAALQPHAMHALTSCDLMQHRPNPVACCAPDLISEFAREVTTGKSGWHASAVSRISTARADAPRRPHSQNLRSCCQSRAWTIA